jgi:Tfp pilus assembly protein PilX
VAATAAWWGANAIEVPVGDLVVADQPRYVIEYLGRFPGDINLSVPGQPADFFQVTARGVAAGGRGEALLRSTYAGYYAD